PTPPRSPPRAPAEPAPLHQTGSPAAALQDAPGRSCAGSRADQQRRQALPPAPQRPNPHSAVPPAGSCRSGCRPPDGPKTTAAAANTTAGPPQHDQPAATAHAQPRPLPATHAQAPLPSALQTAGGSIPQHQGSLGSG